MYEMLILSHGALAEGYHQTMKMILGEEPDITYCALEEDDSSEDLEKKIHTCIPVSYTHLDVYKRQR